jgi:hypothetical protein
MLDIYSGDPFCEGPLECPERRGVDRFHELFANLLVPSGPDLESKGQLDVNRGLQAELPGSSSNIPERYEGESESVVQTLLGPPQLSAVNCPLEIAVYLFYNNLVRPPSMRFTVNSRNRSPSESQQDFAIQASNSSSMPVCIVSICDQEHPCSFC